MNFEERLNSERERWASDKSDSAAWDARALVADLSKAGKYDEAIEFGDEARKLWPEFDPLAGAIAWALYRRDFASLGDAPGPDQCRQAEASLALIRELTSAEPYGTYSAMPTAALALAKAVRKRWPAKAAGILAHLDPSQLSPERSGDFSSPRARWHLTYTAAIEEQGKWKELRTRCEEAHKAQCLESDDLLWINRRLALALENLGSPGEALALLRPLLASKNEWWLWADVARCSYATGAIAEAEEASRKALTAPGKPSFKWKTIHLLGRILAPRDPGAAAEHFLLARTLREKEGWPSDPPLETDWVEVGKTVPLPKIYDERKLRDSWQPKQERVEGVVKKLFETGTSGFITTDSGDDLYFGLRKGVTVADLSTGTRVSFIVVDGFDKKKNKPSQKADDVRPIK